MSDLNRALLRARYVITGRLVMDTALHIGGGRESSTATDSPVVRDPAGQPFVPGSSLKGAFRAAVERLAPSLGLRCCQLTAGLARCASTNKEVGEAYHAISQNIGRELRGQDLPHLNILSRPDWVRRRVTEADLLTLLDEHLCETCKTFGSVHLASVVFFHDLPVEGDWFEAAQIRDGVGIDRDSERAREQIKFDFEVIPSQTIFRFGMSLENPRPRDLALVAIGLREFVLGMVPIGGIRSRGLGRCHLDGLTVAMVDFENAEQRRAYFVHGTMKMLSGDEFIAAQAAAL